MWYDIQSVQWCAFSSSAAFPSPRLAWIFASRVLPTIPNPRSKTEVGTKDDDTPEERNAIKEDGRWNGLDASLPTRAVFLPPHSSVIAAT